MGSILNFLKWDSDNDTMIWKHPETNLSTLTHIIVHESQELCLFSKGKLMEKFGPGKHVITNENIPGFRKLYGIPFGGKNPLTAEAWFINKAIPLNIKWGTKKPLQLEDPQFNIIIPVVGFGQFGIHIKNSEKFLVKIVGTLHNFSQSEIVEYFRGIYMKHINSHIANYIVNKQISVLKLPVHLHNMSEELENKIQEEFEEFGLQLIKFEIESLSPKDNDPSVKKLKEALDKKAEMSIIGFNYEQERSYNVLDKAASNEGGNAGGMMSMGVGLGAGFGIGGTVNKMANNMYQSSNTIKCSNCNTEVNENSKFCPSCGQQLTSNTQITKDRVANVKCDKCGEVFDKTNKFCPHCGDLYNPCPSCGADNPEDAKKCIECGEQMPILCEKCNAKNSPDAKFCSECGAGLRKTCNNCGAVLNDGTKFCPNCGEKNE